VHKVLGYQYQKDAGSFPDLGLAAFENVAGNIYEKGVGFYVILLEVDLKPVFAPDTEEAAVAVHPDRVAEDVRGVVRESFLRELAQEQPVSYLVLVGPGQKGPEVGDIQGKNVVVHVFLLWRKYRQYALNLQKGKFFSQIRIIARDGLFKKNKKQIAYGNLGKIDYI